MPATFCRPSPPALLASSPVPLASPGDAPSSSSRRSSVSSSATVTPTETWALAAHPDLAVAIFPSPLRVSPKPVVKEALAAADVLVALQELTIDDTDLVSHFALVHAICTKKRSVITNLASTADLFTVNEAAFPAFLAPAPSVRHQQGTGGSLKPPPLTRRARSF